MSDMLSIGQLLEMKDRVVQIITLIARKNGNFGKDFREFTFKIMPHKCNFIPVVKI
jgi:hypothetical protein